MTDEQTHSDYLRDLADRLWHVAPTNLVHESDPERLREVARAMDRHHATAPDLNPGAPDLALWERRVMLVLPLLMVPSTEWEDEADAEAVTRAASIARKVVDARAEFASGEAVRS